MYQYINTNINNNTVEKLRYEQELRTRSNKIGLTLIITHIAMPLLSTLLILYLNVAGFYSIANSSNGFYGYDPIAYYLVSGVVVILSLAIPFLILLKCLSVDCNVVLPFQKTGKKNLLALVFFGLSVCMISNMMATGYSLIFEKMGTPMSGGEIYYSSDPIVIFLMILCTALLPALLEEFVFRGVILGSLRKYGDFFAIIISALCFALMHSTILQIPFALPIGLVLGFITVRTNSILPALIIHFSNNFIATINTILVNTVSAQSADIIYILITMICIVGGVYGITYLRSKGNFFTLDNDTSIAITSKERFSICLKSPAIVLCIAMFAISIIVMAVNGGVL